jgi:hypothetical protein
MDAKHFSQYTFSTTVLTELPDSDPDVIGSVHECFIAFL